VRVAASECWHNRPHHRRGVSLRADLDAPAIADDLVERGYIVRALRGNTLQLSPPLVTTDEQVVQLAAALRESLIDADR
jgi:adenosylmethionine-8-amino-7-oxononanoate aminotransferase